MSNRFYYDECAEEIFDSKIEGYPLLVDICSRLNKQEVTIKNYKEEVKKLNVGILNLKNQLKQAKEKLAEKDEEFKDAEEHIDSLELQLREQYQLVDKKDKEIEKFAKFKKKWNFENYEAFEKHYNYLMSLKNKEQLMVENEAMKETIAILLGQKKTTQKHLRHEICEKIREKFGLKQVEQVFNDVGSSPKEIKFTYEAFTRILDQIEGENNGKEN